MLTGDCTCDINVLSTLRLVREPNMPRPKHVPTYNADAHKVLIEARTTIAVKLRKLGGIRRAIAREYRIAYMRHHMRKRRGILTAEHDAEHDAARERYQALLAKCNATADVLKRRQRAVAHQIKLYQTASLYLR